jgi:Raf kinase inhibitor-like YbhB/YbcL family protein
MRVAFLTVAVWTLAFMMAAGQPSSRPLTIEQYKTAGVNIAITSTSFAGNGTIPTKHADYGEKISPALSWTVPPSAKSLVVIVEDPDAKEPKPFVHWVLYNLPPSFAALPEAVPGAPRLPEFGGALQGRNSRGTIGYFGPRPPKGDPAHHYHFQVFAVDAMLELGPGATASVVVAAMNKHVVGRGELVGLYRAP